MPDKTVIYHNPRCSKSRETLALLHAEGVEPDIVHYLDTPPDAATLHKLLTALGLSARELMRSKEELYKSLKLDNPELSEETLVQAMVQHPKLIERPIVLRGKRAVLGRPPERVLELL